MNKRNTALSFGLGLAAGIVIGTQLVQRRKMSPEKVLKQAKEAFKQQGPISGSWIYMNAEKIIRNGLLYNAYRGGVTHTIDGKNKQLEFYADAQNGTIISTTEVS
ncbi:MAG TPA: PepSY domain-containing protein [Bacillota bacterium]|nr:PepSY domain-containing protein [Bacillota bacterium]